jgi:hypothetical protein
VRSTDGRRSLRPLGEVFPPDVDREQRRLEERERFNRQFDIAAAVAAQAAGAEVELVTEVVVIDVLPAARRTGSSAAATWCRPWTALRSRRRRSCSRWSVPARSVTSSR